MAKPINVRKFQEEVFGLVIAVPAYTVPEEDAGSLKRARDLVPDAPVPDEKADDVPLVKLASLAYGKKFVPLTPNLAKRLEGRTVPALAGQGWMDHTSAGRAERMKSIELITIHGVFDAPKQHSALILSELSGSKPKRFTFGAYIYKGLYGTGSSHDPILVFVDTMYANR